MSRSLAPMLAIFLTIGLSVSLLSTMPAVASPPSAFDAAHDARIQVMGPDDAVEPLLSVVCPDGVIVEEGRVACRSCPDDAPDSDGILTMRRIYRGQFSGAATQEAVVALNGCSRDTAERHAIAFLSQTEPDGTDWELVRYVHGQRATPCRIMMIGPTPILLCRTGTEIRAIGHDGHRWHKETLTKVDGDAECEFDGTSLRMQHGFAGPLGVEGSNALALLLEIRHGTPRTEEATECHEEFFDVERSWRLDVFVFSDEGFRQMEFDDPCAHPDRAQILTGVDPRACH